MDWGRAVHKPIGQHSDQPDALLGEFDCPLPVVNTARDNKEHPHVEKAQHPVDETHSAEIAVLLKVSIHGRSTRRIPVPVVHNTAQCQFRDVLCRGNVCHKQHKQSCQCVDPKPNSCLFDVFQVCVNDETVVGLVLQTRSWFERKSYRNAEIASTPKTPVTKSVC